MRHETILSTLAVQCPYRHRKFRELLQIEFPDAFVFVRPSGEKFARTSERARLRPHVASASSSPKVRHSANTNKPPISPDGVRTEPRQRDVFVQASARMSKR